MSLVLRKAASILPQLNSPDSSQSLSISTADPTRALNHISSGYLRREHSDEVNNLESIIQERDDTISELRKREDLFQAQLRGLREEILIIQEESARNMLIGVITIFVNYNYSCRFMSP
jgi:hypothetical protein